MSSGFEFIKGYISQTKALSKLYDYFKRAIFAKPYNYLLIQN